MRRVATALAIALLVPACGGDEETSTGQPSGSADPATSVGATCQPTTALSEPEREEIHAIAQAALRVPTRVLAAAERAG